MDEQNQHEQDAIREENEALQQALSKHLQHRVVELKVQIKQLEAELAEFRANSSSPKQVEESLDE